MNKFQKDLKQSKTDKKLILYSHAKQRSLLVFNGMLRSKKLGSKPLIHARFLMKCNYCFAVKNHFKGLMRRTSHVIRVERN